MRVNGTRFFSSSNRHVIVFSATCHFEFHYLSRIYSSVSYFQNNLRLFFNVISKSNIGIIVNVALFGRIT